MKIRLTLSLLIAKLLSKLLRLSGRGGTSLPGKVALFLYPEILRTLSENVKTIIITGTNGKTTTSRIIAKILENASVRYFENKSGANLLSGVVTSFANHSGLTGKMKYEYAVIECDEAAFKAVSKHIDVKHIVVTNLFRDQLDRYGEISNALNNIIIGIKNSENATVCLNADCSLSSSAAYEISNKLIFFGLYYNAENMETDLSDAPYCIKCKGKYSYNYVTYQHLGDFYCESCGYKRFLPNVYAKDIQKDSSHTFADITIDEYTYKARINLPGIYNVYNAVAAVSVAHSIGISHEYIIEALNSFECGFGRMEKLNINNVSITMILVKNPAGFNQIIDFITDLNKAMDVVFILNDRHADGTDISWIWDVNFEKLKSIENQIDYFIVSGIRAEDMALRLKYADLDTGKIIIYKDYNMLIERITSEKNSNKPVYILPTYTAMFDLRLKLTKKFKIKDFWK